MRNNFIKENKEIILFRVKRRQNSTEQSTFVKESYRRIDWKGFGAWQKFIAFRLPTRC